MKEAKDVLGDGTRKAPADILLPTFSHGRDTAVDLTIWSPLKADLLGSLASEDNIGSTGRKAVKAKIAKYGTACADVQVDFVPLAIEATGGFSDEALAFI